MGYMQLTKKKDRPFLLNHELKDFYAGKLFDYLQAFNRNMLAETLNELKSKLYDTAVTWST